MVVFPGMILLIRGRRMQYSFWGPKTSMGVVARASSPMYRDNELLARSSNLPVGYME